METHYIENRLVPLLKHLDKQISRQRKLHMGLVIAYASCLFVSICSFIIGYLIPTISLIMIIIGSCFAVSVGILLILDWHILSFSNLFKREKAKAALEELYIVFTYSEYTLEKEQTFIKTCEAIIKENNLC